MSEEVEVVIRDDMQDLANRVVEETDVEKTKELVSLFNWNMSKKNVLRILKLNGLLDGITDEMEERLTKRSGEFSNSDLLNYMQAVETAIEKSMKAVSQVDESPKIQVQQNNQINLSIVDTMSRESKEKIIDAVRAFMKNAQDLPIEADCEEVAEDSETKTE